MNLEMLSRARRQLFIITNKDNDEIRKKMEPAFREDLVMKVEVQREKLEDGSWLNAVVHGL